MTRMYVGSEVGKLHRVLLHRPELSLRRLTPRNFEDLLFDDVVRVARAATEHDLFVKTLKTHGVEVLLLHNLLAETLEMAEARTWVLDHQVQETSLGPGLARSVRDYLENMDGEAMASALIGGLTQDDLANPSHSLTAELIVGETDFILPPLPNHLFTRDTSCWIFGGVSLNPMAKVARLRETVHLKAIYRHHPLFADARWDTWFDGVAMGRTDASLEGGDVLVLGNGAVLAGISERTTPQGVEMLAERLFAGGVADRVIAVDLPKHRSCMHLDTVMTQMDVDCFSVYPRIINEETPSWDLTPGAGGGLNVKRRTSFFQTLASACGQPELRIIPTGGDKYEAEREQWNDANNVLTLKPGTVVGYERNAATIAAMEAAGIEVIKIGGEELGRGRGGPRCMSCPIERDGLS
ncbi:MAG: arginine deiminase [Pseudomonadota bacterium]